MISHDWQPGRTDNQGFTDWWMCLRCGRWRWFDWGNRHAIYKDIPDDSVPALTNKDTCFDDCDYQVCAKVMDA